jgi:hypothetical protein
MVHAFAPLLRAKSPLEGVNLHHTLQVSILWSATKQWGASGNANEDSPKVVHKSTMMHSRVLGNRNMTSARDVSQYTL